MQMNELVVQVKYRMESIEDAEKTGDEEKVRASVEELRDFLNLAHADAEIAKAARHDRAGPQPSSKLQAAIDKTK